MKNDKDRYWDCLDQAMEASHGGRIDEALAWLDEALKAHPAGAEAHNGRGEILWDEGRLDEALYEFGRATAADPKFSAAHLNRIELLVEEFGEFDTALHHVDELLAGRPEFPRLDRTFQAELYYLKSKALFYRDDLEGALFLVRRAIKSMGEQPAYVAFEGHVLFEMGHFEEARKVLEQAAAMDPEAPHIIYSLALVLDRLASQLDAPAPGPRRSDEALEKEKQALREYARSAYERANALEPGQYPLPTEIPDAAFREAVADALDNLPRSVRDYIENVPVLVEDYPDPHLVEVERVSPQILGIFVGVPRTEAQATEQVPSLDRVVIYKKNLERVCRDRDELVEQIQITVRHEIGHYLGLDEQDMERLGLA